MRFVLLAFTLVLQLSAAPILQVGTSTSQFGYLDVATGGFTLVGIAAATPVGLGQAVTGNPYLIDDVSNLTRVDSATAALITVGPAGLGLSVGAGSAPGILFGMDYANNLYSINTATGGATLIGATGLPVIDPNDTFHNALAGDGTSLYYIFELAGSSNIASSLYRLNTATGEASLIGLTGTSDIEGAGFGNGVLYAFTGAGGIRTVDLATGASTQTATYAANRIGAIWAASQPVPEPATLPLMCVSLAALTLLRRRLPLGSTPNRFRITSVLAGQGVVGGLAKSSGS